MASPLVWRKALAASELDTTAKAVGFVLANHFNKDSCAWPAKQTLARGASVSKRAADGAVLRLEEAGFISVRRSRGHSSNRYYATLPTVQADAPLTMQVTASLNGANRAAHDSQPCSREHSTVQVAAPEVVIREKRKDGSVDGDGCFVCGQTYKGRYEAEGRRALLVNYGGQWFCDLHYKDQKAVA
jgi:hypothetical protein